MGMYGSPDLTPKRPTTNITYCKKCGAMINKGIKRCPYCHHKNKGGVGIILAVIGIVFLCLICSAGSETPTYTPEVTISKEDFIAECKEYTYKELARNPSQYIDEKVKLKCKVFQVSQYNNNVIILANIESDELFSSDTIYIEYKYGINEPKILEDDNIVVYGVYKGDYSYTTVLGSQNIVPRVQMYFVDIKE